MGRPAKQLGAQTPYAGYVRQKPTVSKIEEHIYRSTSSGLPNFSTYLREFWSRRVFAVEMSKSGMRSSNANNVLGSFWLVLNPLLLAFVYYLLINVLTGNNSAQSDPQRLPHIVGGIFAYYFFAGCMSGGTNSVVAAGRLIMNTPFPRLLLIYSVVRTAFFRFLPTIPVFFIIYLVKGQHFNVYQLLAIPTFFLLLLAGFGIAALLATAQVYFRDTSSFLPYVNRVWLYVSPILFYWEKIYDSVGAWAYLNPLYPIMGIWGDVLIRGTLPPVELWYAATLWSVLIFTVGSILFISKESDFAVRI